MTIQTELRGVEDVTAMLMTFAPKDAINLMRSTNHGMAGYLRDEIKAIAPRDDGDMRKSVKAKRRRMEGGMVRSDVIIEQDAFYWRFVHDGTIYMMGNPFITRAVEDFRANALQSFLDQFVKKLTAGLKRRGG